MRPKPVTGMQGSQDASENIVTGKSDAVIAKVKVALVVRPSNREIIEALVSCHSARGQSAEAGKYRERLRKLADK